MKTLISKLQLHYFEEGDFDKIESRNLEDTLLFIHQFPWEEQRNGIFINLNGPSVTIENGKGAFLKIGVYYNGKFILYYLTESNQIYCRIVDRLPELNGNVEDFFNDRTKETDFNKYRNGVYRRRKHFETGKFEYGVNFWMIGFHLFWPLIMGFIILGILIVHPGIGTAFFTIPCFMFFSGISLMLFINYYFFCRNLYLKVSRGVDEFYFGERNRIRQYHKKDIRTIRTFNNQTHKNPWSQFHTFEIEMRSGEVLTLTSLMIGGLGFKFPEVIINDKHKAIPVARKVRTNIKTI